MNQVLTRLQHSTYALKIVTCFFIHVLGNLLSASYGSASIWGSPNYLVLTSDKSPFESGPITDKEASLVVSIPSFGAILGTIFFSAIIGRYSRKLLLLAIAIMEIVIHNHSNDDWFVVESKFETWKLIWIQFNVRCHFFSFLFFSSKIILENS